MHATYARFLEAADPKAAVTEYITKWCKKATVTEVERWDKIRPRDRPHIVTFAQVAHIKRWDERDKNPNKVYNFNTKSADGQHVMRKSFRADRDSRMIIFR